MLRKALVGMLVLVVALVGAAGVLYVTNATPIVPALSAADSTKPYVVKLHAQWCPYCMLTKDEWAQVQDAYGDRVNLVVLDFTNEAATERSRAEAERLNLGEFFDLYWGATGVVVVLDGVTREVVAEVGGNASIEDYRAAIDTVLAAR